MRIPTILLLATMAHCASTKLLAQNTPAPTPKNLVINGSFETSTRRENLWQGVDSTGYLVGERGQVPVLTASGTIGDTDMPVSASVSDMNGDGLLDILSMDVLGYLRIFFNSGTPQQPKFTVGELGGIFLTRTAPNDPAIGRDAPNARLAPRIFPTDMMRSGKKDLIVGNYLGEVFLVPNGGSSKAPSFRQPPDIARLTIPTMKDFKKRWGNVFAPCTWDWNKDGKDDLLVGEGSYSANNIHLLLNNGSGAKPAFDESKRSVLAFGDGREQLTPTVVDYNGDGAPDLLVAERSGKIAVYLNKGEEAKLNEPPPEIPFASFIAGTGGNPLSFGGISTVATGDLNGDGLFDLVVGKSNGRISMLFNAGTKTEPKFGAQVELKAPQATPPFQIPSGWDVDYGVRRGNFFGFMSVVKAAEDKGAQEVEGKSCLKVGYLASQNKIMPTPTVYTSGFPSFNLKDPRFGDSAANILTYAPARYFMLRQSDQFRLKQKTSYVLTFKVKGRTNDGQVVIGWEGFKKLSDEKVVQGERGSAEVKKNEANEKTFETVRFSTTPIWTEVRKEFRVELKDKNLQDLREMTHALLEISFSIPPGGEAYIDDVKIVERPAA
ncbi:MAG TPA: VCBS repeat-containing protein [Terrimicrobiaceae bacterium]